MTTPSMAPAKSERKQKNRRENRFSIRVYSLHELGKMLHDHGFKVCEVSGRIATPGCSSGTNRQGR